MNALHIYEGDCPDELNPDARDFNCEACLGLISIDKLVKGEGHHFPFSKAIQEQHPELVPVIDSNKSVAFDAVLQKCRELGMEENYNVPMIDNVLEFIELLAKDVTE